MNGPGDIPLTSGTSPDLRPCSLISIIPTLGMSSCRGKAEAFARRLSSKLRTLGSQTDNAISQEIEPIVNDSINPWINNDGSDGTVTDLQPLRHESDTFFDFDCEMESPGSPVDECEYIRLVETASNTAQTSESQTDYACSPEMNSNIDTTDLNAINQTEISPPSPPAQLGMKLPELQSYAAFNDQKYNNNETESHPTLNNLETDEEKIKFCLCTDDGDNFTNPNHNKDTPDKTNENRIQSKNDLAPLKIECELQKAVIEGFAILNGYPKDSLENHKDDEVSPNLSIEYLCERRTENEIMKETDNVDKTDSINSSNASTENTSNKSENSQLSVLDTTDDEDDCRPQRVRRCSSLKSGKTPPGTPGRKKIVRFADKLGLDLADIKTFLDEIPNIPRSAFEDLEILDIEPPIQLGPKCDKILMPLFQQPGGLPTFLDLVREKQVSLENAAVTDHINQTITGSVRVRNLDFHKSVHIRYSMDSWRSFADLQANYVENSCDGFSDKFTFILFGNSMHVGQRLEFAVRFQCKGQQFWDNNYGANYCFQCLPATTTTANTNNIATVVPPHHTVEMMNLLSPSAGDAWCSSFY